MNICFNCGYMYADLDKDGVPITNEYCHYNGPSEWAPCATDEYEPEDYIMDYWADSAEEAGYDEEAAYQEWLAEMKKEEELLAPWVQDLIQPYDYQEF